MKKIFLTIAIFLITLSAVTVFAASEYEETVVLTYDEAVDMILDDMLVLRDLDVTIRDMLVQRRFLADELRRLEGYGENLEIRIMREMLIELDDGIAAVTMGHLAAGEFTNDALRDMQLALAGLTQEGTQEQMLALQTAMAGLVMMSAPDMSVQISQLEHQRYDLAREIERQQDRENINEMTRAARRNLNEFDRVAEILGFNRDQAALGMELALRNMIVAMAEIDRGEALLVAGIDLMEQGVARMKIMHEVGLVSENALSTAEHNLAQSRTQLDELRRGRQTLMHNINYLLGQPLFQDTVIEFERELSEFPEDLEGHIEGLLADTHAVRLSQFDIDRAKEARWVYTGHNREIRVSDNERRRAFDTSRERSDDIWRTYLTPAEQDIMAIRNRIALQEAVERAESSHEQTIRTTQATILRGFNEFEGLIARYEALFADAEQADADVDAAVTGYELGQVTAFDIEQARMELLRIELEKESIRNQKWILMFRLENPSLL
ncbi:MAG: TolC family protein [Defluviitaleaceae bacterium]|nr:TolC family protein [Defluviitaleaceae bacterium]